MSYKEAAEAAALRAYGKTLINYPIPVADYGIRAFPILIPIPNKVRGIFIPINPFLNTIIFKLLSKVSDYIARGAGGGIPPIPPYLTAAARIPGNLGDNRGNSNNPNNPGRGSRRPNTAPRTEIEDKNKLKRNNIGIFNLFIEDLNDIGIIKSSNNVIYTDAAIFKIRLITLFENDIDGTIYK